MPPRFRKTDPLARLTAIAALLALAPLPVLAGPNGGTVVSGSATIVGPGSNSVTINQSSQNAIINWNTFNIGVGETTTFNQPNNSAIALNRVTGGLGPSQILGTLTANGRVFVVNGDGIIFGRGATINTAGFLATTSDIHNADFMAGHYNFNIPGRPTASIINYGNITAANGGFAALVAPGVRNAGTITATLGTVALAAGNVFTLDFYGDRLITLAVNDQIAANVMDVSTGQTLTSLVSNSGKLKANGGTVQLTAAAARAVVDSVINNTGAIEANSIGTHNGMIVLGAATESTKPNGAPVQTVKLSGKISAAGKKPGTTGGTIVVTGENIQVTNAQIDASGQAGGGTVLIGGDTGGGHPSAAASSIALAAIEPFAVPTATTVSVDAASTINSSATGSGNGGKVVLWSDQQTTFAGTILALGGPSGGNGGFVETSSHGVLNFTGNVSTLAPMGQAGTALLDPSAAVIDLTCTSIPSCITTSAVQTGLGGGNFIVTTGSGDLTVDSNVNLSWAANTLTLSAAGSIVLNSGSLMTGTGTSSLILRADNAGIGSTVGHPNNIQFISTAQVDFSHSNRTVSFYYNPTANPDHPELTKYGNPTDFVGSRFVLTNSSVPNQFAAYMLVNNAADLALIGTNNTTLAQTYALGTNIDASTFAGFASGTMFNGTLTGNGGLGVTSTISGLNLSSTHAMDSYGLFPFIGTNGVVRDLNISGTVTAGANFQIIGLLAGSSSGTVTNVQATGTVNGGTFQGIIAGGLIGQNGTFNGASDVGGAISRSFANVTVTVGDSGCTSNSNCNAQNSAGGLAGSSTPSSVILDSVAIGSVTAGAFSNAGGLIGQNWGTVGSSRTPTLTSSCVLGAAFSCAAGAVSVGSQSSGGGFFGWNDGSITNALAIGNVAGAAGVSTGGGTGDQNTRIGGFGGTNHGTLATVVAIGNVGTSGVAALTAGGLIGSNKGSVNLGIATGNVQAGADSQAGAFVGENSPDHGFNCGGCTVGIADNNLALITTSVATGNVSVGAASFAGGFGGVADGVFATDIALGNVSGGANSVLGGFLGAMGVGQGPSQITLSFASGNVNATGANSVVGGFIGANGGRISGSGALGNVNGTADSFLGGFAGVNIGQIQDSAAIGSVTATGANNVAGGLVGLNFGTIDPSTSTGAVTSGANSIVGGLVGVNGAFSNFPAGFIPVSFPVGTISSDSVATGTATGGAGSTVGVQIGENFPTSGLPSYPSTLSSCNNELCTILTSGTLTDPNTNNQPPPATGQQPLVINNLVNYFTLASTVPGQVVDTTALNQATGQPNGQPPGARPGGPSGLPPQFGPRFFVVPPPGAQFVPNELVVQVPNTIPMPVLNRILQQLGLSVISSQMSGLLGVTTYQLHIDNGGSVAAGIQALANYQVIAGAQANLKFFTVQDRPPELAQDPDLAGRTQEGDAAQYALGKLGVANLHRFVRGANVTVAVIDSQIDVNHPDIQGVIAEQFDAVGKAESAHPHGTGMAGAIVAHRRLMGIAPSAKLYAVHAFSSGAATAESTTYSILKALDWAAAKGVRVINMSFAGPRDPSMERALRAAHDKGIVLIAAAGNAGPKSPPLFPGADPNVIAVTATDINDKLFTGANRGRYIAVAAPGVDILVPAPDNTYQLTTGTSVASAEVSGIAALLLERNPDLSPEEVRRILTASAHHMGPKDRDDDYGSGLVDPSKALQQATEVKPIARH